MKAPPRPDLGWPRPIRVDLESEPRFTAAEPGETSAAPRPEAVPGGPALRPSMPPAPPAPAPPVPQMPPRPDGGSPARTPQAPSPHRPTQAPIRAPARGFEAPPGVPVIEAPAQVRRAPVRTFEAPHVPVRAFLANAQPRARVLEAPPPTPVRPDVQVLPSRAVPVVPPPRRELRPSSPPMPTRWHAEPGRPKRTAAPPEPRPRSWFQALVAAAAVLVVVAGSVATLRLGPGSVARMLPATREGKAAEPSPSPLPVFHGPSHLAVLAIRAEPESFVALIASHGERPALGIDIPGQTVLPMPGSGSGTVSDAVSGDMRLLSISISNTLGALTEHGAILNEGGLARAVDAAHGIPVSLLDVETLGGKNVGPGVVRMSGQQVVDYLAINRAFDRSDRWRAVLKALLSGGLTLRSDDVVESDGLSGMNQAIAAARGAMTRELPTRESAGGLLLPEADPIRNMLSVAFGIEVPKLVPVVVLNGSGAPGVGAKVAEKLVPGGFQVVASQNAPKFNQKTTTVYANTQDSFPAAERAGRLLGVGAVTLGQSPVSGLADITIVVGKDF